MDKEVIWTNEVYQDLESTAEYIARDSIHYASAFVEEVIFAGSTLEKLAERGRRVPEFNDPSIHEIFIKEYRLIYKLNENQVFILALVHGGRDLKALWRKHKRDKKY